MHIDCKPALAATDGADQGNIFGLLVAKTTVDRNGPSRVRVRARVVVRLGDAQLLIRSLSQRSSCSATACKARSLGHWPRDFRTLATDVPSILFLDCNAAPT